MIPYTTKVNERLIGQPITNESHIVGIIGITTYSPGQIRLIEVPQGPAPAITIPGYTEITSGSPTNTEFIADYETGVVTFNVSQNGTSVLVSYTGTGSEIAAEDVNEVQEPLNSIASLSITYNWPLAPTVGWSLAPGIAVTSLYADANPPINGSIQLASGTNVTLSQIGQVITINSTGGSGTPGGTTGSVQFNSSGTLGGDATHFYWDSINFRLGLDTNSPISTLDDSGSFGTSIRVITSSTTATATDYTILADATSGVVNITLPVASTVSRRIYEVKKIDSSANLVSLIASGVDTIDGMSSFSMSVQWQATTVQSNGTNWFVL